MSFDEDPNMEPTAICRQCGNEKNMSDKSLKDWQMQHLHFEDGDIDFLTCEKCKTLSPMRWLETIGSERENML